MFFKIQARVCPFELYIEELRLFFNGEYVSNGHWIMNSEIFNKMFMVLKPDDSRLNLDKPFAYEIFEKFLDTDMPDINKATKDVKPGEHIADTDLCFEGKYIFKAVNDGSLVFINKSYYFFISQLGYYNFRYWRDEKENSLLLFNDDDELIFRLMTLKSSIKEEMEIKKRIKAVLK